MFRLHYAPRTISVASAIALEEASVAYEPVRVDFASAEQTGAAYLALNPKGRVPLLETPHGLLTETGAILELVAPGLVPVDPWDRARMRETLYYLASTMHVAHAHKMRGSRWADLEASHADMRAKVPQTMAASCAYLEGHLPLAPFAQGAQITVADPYLFVVLSWVEGDGVALADYPKLSAFAAMMETRASVKAVRAMGML